MEGGDGQSSSEDCDATEHKDVRKEAKRPIPKHQQEIYQ